MAIICPTVTAYDSHEYRAQIENIEAFAERIHIDLMDGKFAPTVSPALKSIWWPEGMTADIHLMYEYVEAQLETILNLKQKPNLVIVHAEVHGRNDLPLLAARLRERGIKAGIALLPETTVETASYLLPHFQHVLIFSGHLGYHGGIADLKLLEKANRLKRFHPHLEISWDGGITDQNVKQLYEGGIDVLNVGGFIQKAENPEGRFNSLASLLQS